jgi:2-polyprenyl-3-methyl-5-hydroxy-6-metoxy-1,4-benzoquinol methylase
MEDAANRIVEHYERHALSWDADRRAAAWIDKPFIERFLGLLTRGATVLDLGCGGGSPVALHMVAQGFRVAGVDSSAALISLCRTRMPDQEWIVGDMRSLALGRQFDGYWRGTASFISATQISGRYLAYLPRMRPRPLF